MGKCQHRSNNSLHRPITSFFTLSREILKHFRTYGPNLAFYSIALSSVGGVHPTRCQSGMQPGEIWWWSEREARHVMWWGCMEEWTCYMVYSNIYRLSYPIHTSSLHRRAQWGGGWPGGVKVKLKEGCRWRAKVQSKEKASKLMGENFRLKWRAEWDKRREMATGQFGQKEIGWKVTGQSVGRGSC